MNFSYNSQETPTCRYKLRLRPRSMPARLSLSNLPKLPPGKDVVQIFGDFMSYLMSCTEKFIQETHPNLVSSWPMLRQRAEFVITHPNGWQGTQQAKLRKAAILGNLIPNTAEGKARVTFVSEGEASLHYCIGEGLVGRVSAYHHSTLRMLNECTMRRRIMGFSSLT